MFHSSKQEPIRLVKLTHREGSVKEVGIRRTAVDIARVVIVTSDHGTVENAEHFVDAQCKHDTVAGILCETFVLHDAHRHACC